MTFRVGQKVVCVHPCNDLASDKIYTITSLGLLGKPRNEPAVGVDQSNFGPRPAFYSWRFRALVERKTDISIFTAMLTSQGVDA